MSGLLLIKRRHAGTFYQPDSSIWVHNVIKGRLEQGAYHNLVKELEMDREKYQKYFRRSPEKLKYIFALVGPLITKKTVIREPLDAKIKLVICIW